MRSVVMAAVLAAATVGLLGVPSPAAAQSKAANAARRADPCAPIGKTADGKLVYSMKCDAMPVVVAPSRAEAATAPVETRPVEPEDQGGLFRNPFPSLIRPSTDQRSPGVGPSQMR